MLKQAGSQRILLVEDEKLAQKVHCYYLRKLGYEVHIASTGKEAVESSGETDFSAMVLDLGLPDMNGSKVLAEIRKREERTGRYLPVIVVTAHGDKNILTHLKRKKADFAFVKPVKFSDFTRSLQVLYLQSCSENWIN